MTTLAELHRSLESGNNSRIANFASEKVEAMYKQGANAYDRPANVKVAPRNPTARMGANKAAEGIGEAANAIGRKTKAAILSTSKTGKKFIRQGWKNTSEVAGKVGGKIKEAGNLAMKHPGKSAAILGAAATIGAGGYYLASRDKN